MTAAARPSAGARPGWPRSAARGAQLRVRRHGGGVRASWLVALARHLDDAVLVAVLRVSCLLDERAEEPAERRILGAQARRQRLASDVPADGDRGQRYAARGLQLGDPSEESASHAWLPS